MASFDSADNLQTRPPMRRETTAPQAPSLSHPIASRRRALVTPPTFALKSSSLAVNVRSDSSDTTPPATSDINSQPRIRMGKTIEFPDPLFAEIDGYAHRVAASPITVIRQAWEEFRHHHPPESVTPAVRKPDTEELLSMVRVLRGSISLPADVNDETLITEARLEKHGPVPAMTALDWLLKHPSS